MDIDNDTRVLLYRGEKPPVPMTFMEACDRLKISLEMRAVVAATISEKDYFRTPEWELDIDHDPEPILTVDEEHELQMESWTTYDSHCGWADNWVKENY